VSVTRGVTLLAALLTMQLFGPTHLDPVIVSLYVEGCALAVLWSYYSYRVDEVDSMSTDGAL